MSCNTVTLTLASAVTEDDAVLVGYTQPTKKSGNPVRDLAGNAAPSFSGQTATNNTEAAADPPLAPEPEESDPEEPPEPLAASTQGVPGSHDGQNVLSFDLRFSEELKTGFKFKTLQDHALTATGSEITRAKRLDKTSNLRWSIHVQPDGNGILSVVLPVTTDCDAEHAVCTGDGRPLSYRLELTVSEPAQ